MSESVQAIPRFVEVPERLTFRVAVRPSPRDWLLHSLLFLITVITTTVAGIVTAAPVIDVPEPALATAIDYLLYVPQYYLRIVNALLAFAILNPNVLAEGLVFPRRCWPYSLHMRWATTSPAAVMA